MQLTASSVRCAVHKVIRDSGKEGLSPKKEHKMFGGLYDSVRHPQTSGGVLLWFAEAIGSHSLFLVLYSSVWIPIYWIACHVEEADLLRRYGRDYEEYQERVGMFLPSCGTRVAGILNLLKGRDGDRMSVGSAKRPGRRHHGDCPGSAS